jgi:GT2 family glycosyltransferase
MAEATLIKEKEPIADRRPALRSVPRALEAPEVSILIVTWNSARWIGRCLDAIPPACNGLRYEVVVCDNASSDDTLARLGDDNSQTIIRETANIGFGPGMNRALQQSRGRYVFLLNPDCELGPNALQLLRDFLDAHPHAAGAAPLLSDDGGDVQREFQLRRLPTLKSLTAEVLGFDKLFPANRRLAHQRYRDLELKEPSRIEQPAAAALLLRRELFDEVGTFDEQFSPAWFEDVDFCKRLAARGKEMWVVPAAQARHFGGASLEHVTFEHFVDVWYGNMWRYARKWLPAADAEALRWAIIAGMILRLGAATLGIAHPEEKRGEVLRGYANVLKKAFNRWDA